MNSQTLKQSFKKRISEENLTRYRTVKRLARLGRHLPRRVLAPHDLTNLAAFHDCDKWGVHDYTPIYESYLELLRNKPLSLLEIGIGGYDEPKKGGASLRMWADYFPNSRIYGIDVYDKSHVKYKRVRTFRGSQVDRGFLEDVLRETGKPDLIIDDGSHVNEHVIATFEILFPELKPGGLYFVEDAQTSYWPDYGGGTDANLPTMMNYFKSLADDLNYREYCPADHSPTVFQRDTLSVHFYHNLILVKKK